MIGPSSRVAILRRLCEATVLVLQRHFLARAMEGLEDAGPEAGLAPQAVATVDRVPWTEVGWELMPGSIGAEHPEDAGQHSAGRSADATDRCSGSKQRLDAGPLFVRQVCPVRHRSRGARRGIGWDG